MEVKNSMGSSTAGMNTSQAIVCPATLVRTAGISRSAPSANPMYQSGWEPAEAAAGV